jgi:hypothetical protein
MTNTPQQQLDAWQRRWSSFASDNGFVKDPEKELDGEYTLSSLCIFHISFLAV